MALEVPGESLCSVADADLYHDGRGNAATWTALEKSRKEQLLRQAYDYLYGEYASAWPAGVPFGMLADESIAKGARDACAVLALKAKDGPLDPEITPQVIEKETGPIKKKFAEAANGGRRTFPDVARLIGPYLPPIVRGSVPLVRA